MPAFSSTSARRPPRATRPTLATNLLAPYLLTQMLLPRLRESAPSRIINVSSGGMYATGLALDDLQYEKRTYDGSRAYARTKRALVTLTEIWAEQLKDSGVVVHAMHPGWADTPGVAGSLPAFHTITRRFLRTAGRGRGYNHVACGRAGSGQGQRRVLARPRAAHHPRLPRHRSIAAGAAGIVGRAGETDRLEREGGDRGC